MAVVAPRANPTSVGMPGGPLMQDVLNWSAYGAIVACVLAVIYGGLKLAIARKGGSGVGQNEGRGWIAGGVLGGLAVAAASDLVEFGGGLADRLGI